MYEEQLREIGLSHGESRVYLSLLEIGSSTVGPIAKKSKVAYSKIYEVLERLIVKGLVSFTVREKTKYFQALEPVRISDLLDKKEEELRNNRKVLTSLISGLNKLKSKEKKEASEIFVGEKGLTTAYDLLLEEADEGSILRFFYMHDPSYDDKVYEFCYGRVNYNRKKIIPMLKEKRMKWQGIVNRENYSKPINSSSEYIVQRYVSFPVPGNIDLTNNSILITTWGDKPLAILIKSQEVAQNLQRYFDYVWKIAKK